MQLSGKWKLTFFLPLFALLITACSSQKFTPRTDVLPPASGYLTEQDVLDINPTMEVTEEDIQDAIKAASSGVFELRTGDRIILVQSGATVPDSVMQEAMMAHYQVSVYSGIAPVKPRPKLARKGEIPLEKPEPNYIKTLRLAAAKAKQDKIIVYWGYLELGKLDTDNKTVVWQRYLSGDIPSSTKSLRYLIRFALVDVKTGMWTMYASINHQDEYMQATFKRYENDVMQVNRVKEASYRLAAQNLANHFDKPLITAKNTN